MPSRGGQGAGDDIPRPNRAEFFAATEAATRAIEDAVVALPDGGAARLLAEGFAAYIEAVNRRMDALEREVDALKTAR